MCERRPHVFVPVCFTVVLVCAVRWDTSRSRPPWAGTCSADKSTSCPACSRTVGLWDIPHSTLKWEGQRAAFTVSPWVSDLL